MYIYFKTVLIIKTFCFNNILYLCHKVSVFKTRLEPSVLEHFKHRHFGGVLYAVFNYLKC